MNDRGGTVRRWIVIVAVLVILVICTILMVEPMEDMSTIVMGVSGAVIYLLHDLFLIWFIVPEVTA